MDKIGFKLNKINTQQFAIIDDSYSSEKDDFTIETNLGFGIDSKNAAIISLVKIEFEQDQNPFLIIEVSCEFDISSEFWKEFDNKDKVRIPKGFMAHLAMITVGTTRGILHSKTENTKFNEFILPTLNITEMITEDGVFKK
ncbi:hypothetical protein [Mesoflavibacter sp. CH_XMU1422-2]|uniref:hypothetical protein n=1 Tax=Mesoflavibacter sp. CH_XMU1422-2 TaxID=3107770 RepID=UPI0030084B7A|nr:hypothetical protein [Mesoflavibacter sp.]